MEDLGKQVPTSIRNCLQLYFMVIRQEVDLLSPSTVHSLMMELSPSLRTDYNSLVPLSSLKVASWGQSQSFGSANFPYAATGPVWSIHTLALFKKVGAPKKNLDNLLSCQRQWYCLQPASSGSFRIPFKSWDSLRFSELSVFKSRLSKSLCQQLWGPWYKCTCLTAFKHNVAWNW